MRMYTKNQVFLITEIKTAIYYNLTEQSLKIIFLLLNKQSIIQHNKEIGEYYENY